MLVYHKLSFAASLIVGVSATYFLVQLLEWRSQLAVVNVVVARESLMQGTTLLPEHLDIVDWPAKSAPTGAYATPATVLGQMLREPMVPGEPFLPGKLWPEGSKGSLIDAITIGQRAMTVRVQEISGIAAEELVGASADVLLASRDAQNQPFSQIILENVQVLSVPGTARSDNKTRTPGINAVTLQLSPEDAQRLNLARSMGTLSLSLRHHGDVQESRLPSVPRAQLLGQADTSRRVTPSTAVPVTPTATAPAAMVSEAMKSGQGVEVIRGAQLVTPP